MSPKEEANSLVQIETSIKELFTGSNAHVRSDTRLEVLTKWVGNCMVNLLFLQQYWEDPLFRPFDTAVTSERYLRMDLKHAFLIRLSSQPGKVTVTCKTRTRGIIHSRFFITEKMELADSKGNKYNTIQDLADEISGTLAKHTRHFEPATYI